jgi:hypothetical protein
MLAWFLHESGKDRVVTGDITDLYKKLHINPPNVSQYLGYQTNGKVKYFLRDKRGFRLEGRTRTALQSSLKIGDPLTPLKSVLTDLLAHVSEPSEKLYLEEALRCYSVGAFRAAVVMVWNLAYSHLSCWILEPTRTARFNSAVVVKYPKNTNFITDLDSFGSFKEFEVIEIAQTAKLIDKNRAEILKDKLRKRNMAAHPSTVLITQLQVDDLITDLVNNIIRKL